MINTKLRTYQRLSFSTLVAVFVLILAGGVVRSTGSGMGCPDWPKCFGQWVPPTHIDQLPANYKEVYSEFRHQKNLKFAAYLRTLGMQQTAQQILSDESIREEADFNAVKTWTEYINRLLGVLVGFLILLMAFVSLSLRINYKRLTYITFVTLLTIIFQGWLGSIVVSTNLLPWLITIHMLFAMLIVLLLVYLFHHSSQLVKGSITNSVAGISDNSIHFLLITSIFILLIQIVLGTQVREEVDRVAILLGMEQRNIWMEHLDIYFIIHRSFSWIVLLINGLVAWKLLKSNFEKNLVLSIIIIILTSFVSGVAMAYLGIPAALQPMHLVLAILAFGLQFLLLLRLKPELISKIQTA
jgi:heme a synthase